MANKVYPFKIKPTDILIQNEGGGGMLMNDQFVSIVGNVIPDQQKLLDDQINVNDVNVQTNVFSSGIFITNAESNPLPIEDLASKNFDSLDENVTESEVVVAQPNEPDNLQLPIIISSVLPSPSPTPTPSPSLLPLTPEEIEEGIYIANFLPSSEEQEFQLFDTVYEDDEILNDEVVKGIEKGTTKIISINELNTPIKYNISKVTLSNISSYVKFAGKGTVGKSNALQDWKDGKINPKVIEDIATAAKAAGVIVTITTAKTGHKETTKSGNTSRHVAGTGVDIAIIDGIGSGGATNATNGNSKFRNLGNKLKNALVQMGYIWNKESGNNKAVLWQTNISGNHYNHLHVSNRLTK
jgi:hypothetical protein